MKFDVLMVVIADNSDFCHVVFITFQRVRGNWCLHF